MFRAGGELGDSREEANNWAVGVFRNKIRRRRRCSLKCQGREILNKCQLTEERREEENLEQDVTR